MQNETDNAAAGQPGSPHSQHNAATPTEVYISDPTVTVKGIECIFHNMYANSDFTTFCKWYDDCDADDLLLFIADHVRQGLYSIIALNVTKHMFVVTIACEKNKEDLPDGWFVYEKPGGRIKN